MGWYNLYKYELPTSNRLVKRAQQMVWREGWHTQTERRLIDSTGQEADQVKSKLFVKNNYLQNQGSEQNQIGNSCKKNTKCLREGPASQY